MAFHCTREGAFMYRQFWSQNRWVDPLQGVDPWRSLAKASRVCGVSLTREVLSSTWGETFGEGLILLSVNTPT